MLRLAAVAFVMALGACASAHAPSPAAVAPEPPDAALPRDTTPPPMTTMTLDAPERSRPPSTASYDQALSTPEPIDIHDDRAHLTDVQLTSPMGAALVGCRVPASAKVTIKTAVQDGRAIGVTVDVRFEKPKSARQTLAAVKAERKAIAKIAACVDQNVRAIVWPPSRRRDSFTTEL